ncbi:hypothetical protein JVX90_09735 [Gordonia sp. PDNC005]|uniref:hypothetical protein n=1 Tax=unclassified Gordonia (in: high G+C Gram-positive bacteria) TaxID=2657482 RepID=UPI001962777F|nr:hypothetical protein [Gordonia sp. PDNC005]QRY64417.1 hypothetical protein JVX90_09735 [Gordonia sp. PDNC005]
MVTMVVVVGVVLWPRAEISSNVFGPPMLGPLSTQPTEAWKVTARDILRDEGASGELNVVAESGGVLLVEGVADPYSATTTLAAIDVVSGKVAWHYRSPGHWSGCAYGGDGVFACVKIARDQGTVAVNVVFIDATSGDVEFTRTIRNHGRPSIVGVDDGVVVAVAHTDRNPLLEEGPLSLPSRSKEESADTGAGHTSVITRFSADGRRLWTSETAPGVSGVVSVPGADVVVVTADDWGAARGAFEIYRVDDGRRLHSEPGPPPTRSVCLDTGGGICTVVAGGSTAPTKFVSDQRRVRANSI